VTSFARLPAEERALFFRELVLARGVAPVIAEKDFWICWLLGCLFAVPDLRPDLVFKGGTSLSKVFGVIDRFSEDIDLSVSPGSLGWNENDLDEAPSASMRTKRMKKLEADCIRTVEQRFLPAIEAVIRARLGAPASDAWLRFEIDAVSKSPVLLFRYPTSTEVGTGYIQPIVKIELGSLTDQRPTGTHSVRPMVADVAPDEFDDFTAEVVALEVERTFWEKATILHAEHHRPAELPMRDRFARHYGDFAALWRHPHGQRARTDLALLARVVTHKGRFFRSRWSSYDTARPGTLRLTPPKDRESELRKDLDKMRPMFIGDAPDFGELLATLREAEDAINSM
jgi:hypothetical protein